jgi:hypothetical protein
METCYTKKNNGRDVSWEKNANITVKKPTAGNLELGEKSKDIDPDD